MSVALADVVDQASRAHTKPLTFTELTICRNRYVAAAGCAPPDEQTPSAEQLAALRALIASGRVPYVDFAVWGPYGARVARFKKTEAAIFVGNTIVQKRVDGPTSFDAWLASWDLFTVAMVSLGAARLGNLMKYRAGMVQLTRLFPAHWSVLQTTDMILRSERWGRIREGIESCIVMGGTPPGFDPLNPWDLVIACSSYGAGGANTEWWQSHFVLPCTVNAGAAPAANMIKAIEGYPGGHPSSSSSGSTDRPRADKAPRADKTPRAGAGEVCTNYNTGTGDCAKPGPCKHGRRHVCDVCGGFHRRVEKHVKQDQGWNKRSWKQGGDAKRRR